MLTDPRIVERADQPYAAVRLELAQSQIPIKAPPLIDDVVKWIKAQGAAVSGPPFFNYVNFTPDRRMEMEVGTPTESVLAPTDDITTGTLRGGRYVSVTHTGPYDELGEVNMMLDKWASEQGLKLDGVVAGDRFVGATRLEMYHKDPGEDPSGHPVTEVAFRIAT